MTADFSGNLRIRFAPINFGVFGYLVPLGVFHNVVCPASVFYPVKSLLVCQHAQSSSNGGHRVKERPCICHAAERLLYARGPVVVAGFDREAAARMAKALRCGRAAGVVVDGFDHGWGLIKVARSALLQSPLL